MTSTVPPFERCARIPWRRSATFPRERGGIWFPSTSVVPAAAITSLPAPSVKTWILIRCARSPTSLSRWS